ncbi:glycosyl hydrolase 115 family protein [Isoptericola nanjingensis]|uniref:glycosyl hydrolase 115 family protein n=1 Tax=Isoptericola nanjingensis TaxID=903413 RepID=UPI003D1CB6F1
MTLLLDDVTSGLVLAAPGAPTAVVADTDDSAIGRAAAHLAADLGRICAGASVRLTTAAGAGGDVSIVVGTVDSPIVRDAVASGELDLAPLYAPDGRARWEAFVLRVVGDRLFAVGSDRRGAVFGVYHLTEAAGVSPWHWFADVPVRRRDHVTVPRDLAYADHPSVKFRGIFLNDEEELDAWARRHTHDGTIGPETYERIFELLLRLKGNYIWPAMHVNAFNADPRNARLAHEMGVVVGTSHCDMLLRSNQHEWEPWAAARGEGLEYDYSLPGRNREALHEYWRGSVEQNGGFDVTWTLGMRGIHDSGFHTAEIDADPHLSDDERVRARVRLLEQVIADQRQLLADTLGDRAADAVQTFVPYKEVLDLYDAGLDLPDDVVTIWTDDSFGYVRRYPDAAERQRSGGHGLYYHSSYWSPPSRSYLFISSTPLAHMRNELDKAWDHGIRTLWVDNIGALKPLEQDTEFFLRHAWEAGKPRAEQSTADATAWTERWVDRDFSRGIGKQVAALYDEFAQITNVRKIEHLSGDAFSQTSYGDEAGRRLDRLRDLYGTSNALRTGLPEAERDAFFQLVGMKIHASYLVNAQFYYADRSTLAYRQGKYAAADRYLEVSREFDAHKRAMIAHYNQVMSGGKWDGILTPEAFPPPTTALFPAGRPALRVGQPRLGVVVWGDDGPVEHPELVFSPHGVDEKWIEVFTGGGPIEVTMNGEPWLEIGEVPAVVETEARVRVRLVNPAQHGGTVGTIVVTSPTDGRTVSIAVRVLAPPSPTTAEPCALEADGYVSLRADRPDECHETPGSRWREVAGAGRDLGSLLQVHGDGGGATVGYRVHLAKPGAHLLELHRYPHLDSTGRIRVRVGVDDHPPVDVESDTTDEYRGTWESAVVDNVERLRVRLPYLTAGVHTIRLVAVDEGFALSALVVYTSERRPTSLGPPPSRRTDGTVVTRPESEPHRPDLETPVAVARDHYRVDPRDVAPHPAVVVPRTYWDGETTFVRNVVVPQPVLGAARDRVGPDGRKDVLATLPTGPVVEKGGALALDVERALVGDRWAWITPSLDVPEVAWTHTQAETAGGTGLALHVAGARRRWGAPLEAPAVHLTVHVKASGRFTAWVLVKFDAADDDSLVLGVDGRPQPVEAQFGGGDLFSFGLVQVWTWIELSELDLDEGRHVLSVHARKSGLRIARLYLTRTQERPPTDGEWPE